MKYIKTFEQLEDIYFFETYFYLVSKDGKYVLENRYEKVSDKYFPLKMEEQNDKKVLLAYPVDYFTKNINDKDNLKMTLRYFFKNENQVNKFVKDYKTLDIVTANDWVGVLSSWNEEIKESNYKLSDFELVRYDLSTIKDVKY